ncbi:3'-5' exonuclease [Bifidobacterium gallicum]|uniref:DNA polymerase III subunit alpha n=1 Tax=Bifidobacterium gallicum DSM 20093 = LMG 11596 TaxID=561180 RepID=D1NTJ1_9BIFI|nr:exonuclease domain-containing protein [Bifidobacterium gallicum]EFA23044.1 exonuclease, DNA polymerase III, epsilon subunit family [Bifidobacterium gallicum DSM 20093 = LMG 11596]KFI57650.1 DNA polymerase III subunit alpha [Bifidobacterium gallicum DSM 20093 = LMG 11596]
MTMVIRTRHNPIHMPLDYISLDIETTGLAPRQETITEIGAVRVRDGRIADRFSMLINPGKHIPSRITALTGISDAMVEDAPMIDEAIPAFVDWVDGDRLIGHNIRFDLSFLLKEAMLLDAALATPFNAKAVNPAAMTTTAEITRAMLGPDPLDTMMIDRWLFPSERHRLSDLIVRYGVADTEAHRALSDATQTYQCFEWQRRYVAASNLAHIVD